MKGRESDSSQWPDEFCIVITEEMLRWARAAAQSGVFGGTYGMGGGFGL